MQCIPSFRGFPLSAVSKHGEYPLKGSRDILDIRRNTGNGAVEKFRISVDTKVSHRFHSEIFHRGRSSDVERWRGI
jgi:hypothetical protein